MRAESSTTEVSTTELLSHENEAMDDPKSTVVEVIVPPDGGYGWVIVVAVFFVHVFVLGNVYSFGILYPVFIDAFDSNKGTVAWVGSIGAALMVGLGAWTGSLADRYGNNRIIALGACCIGLGYALASLSKKLWQLYLTLGVIAGFGYSFAFISAVSVVGQWFKERRGLALGAAVAGSGLGQFAMTQISGALLLRFSWRGTLLILALINFVGLMICSLFIKRLLPLTKHNAIVVSQLDNFKDRNFLFLFCGAFVNSLGSFMPYSHLPIYSELHGLSTGQAVFILSMVGVASACGRLTLGWLADCFGKLLMLQICVLSSGVSTLCWLACTNFGSILTYGIIFGFVAGGVISLLPSVAAELFGTKRMGSIIGLLYSSTATGNLLSAPIGGFLFDKYQSYTPPIIIAGSFLLSGVFFMFLVKHDTKKVEVDAVDTSNDSERNYKLQQQEPDEERRDDILVEDDFNYDKAKYQLNSWPY